MADKRATTDVIIFNWFALRLNKLSIEAIETHAGTYLDKIGVCLDTNRNFMMHSDGATITKIDTYPEASSKLDEIHNDIKEIFIYFKKGGAFGL